MFGAVIAIIGNFPLFSVGPNNEGIVGPTLIPLLPITSIIATDGGGPVMKQWDID